MIYSYETVTVTVPRLAVATKLFGVKTASKPEEPPIGAHPH
jgi:hypothetical protein